MNEYPTFANLEQKFLELKEYQNSQATINLLSLLYNIDDVYELFAELVLLIRNWSECDAVGIRMNENNHYPYVQTLGFSQHHIDSENHICAKSSNKEKTQSNASVNTLLSRMCGKVISGNFDPLNPFFTEYGSFITNSTSELWSTNSHEFPECKSCYTCHSEGYESIALIPIKNSTETFGLIQINDSRKGVFSSQLISFLEKLAFNLSISLGKKRTAQQLRKSNEELTAIYENAPIIMIVINKYFEVISHNAYTKTFFKHADQNLKGSLLAEVVKCPNYFSFSEYCCLYCNYVDCDLGKFICNTFQQKRNYNNVEARINVLEDEETKKKMFFLSSTLLNHDTEPKVLITMLDITERKIFEEQLNEMNYYDSLTGLYNLNFFLEEMKRFQSGRYIPISIIICDIDGFKFVNHTLGHQSGDDLLINTGKLLRNNFRASDIIARLRGDEFAVIVPSTSKPEVRHLVQRLINSVQAYNNSDPRIQISLSIGYAVGEQRPLNVKQLFHQAYDMIYKEKRQRESSTENSLVKSMIKALDSRDFIKQGHSHRLQELIQYTAKHLNLSDKMIHDLFLFARFHDFGKVGIPDHILFKQSSLNAQEVQEVHKHSEIGQRIAQTIPGLDPIAKWILLHHERWDGKGYPLGLQGENIPLACRILAIADAYETMTNDRPYRKAMSSEEAIAELRRCAGTQFDPALVERFIKALEDFQKN